MTSTLPASGRQFAFRVHGIRVSDMADVARRLAEVQARVRQAALDAGRQPGSVRLVAISKTFTAEEIRPALEAGQRLLGENRVQEAKAKFPGLKADYPDLELHLVGPLQSNKVREAVGLFDVIHSLDREKLAEALAAEAGRAGRCPRLLVQVNTGEEPQKAGIAPAEAVDFSRRCREVHGLPVVGLMCIPPVEEEPAVHFALLAKLASEAGLAELSMGMSGDFETAIAFGATLVRVGSAIFGTREAA